MLKYLLKYILKGEKRSDFYANIRKFISTKIDDATEMKKTFQRILLRNVGERDMSVNECMLIAHDQPYVDFSGTPRIVDLRGNRRVKDAKDLKKKTGAEDPENQNKNEDMQNPEDLCIGESSNWQEKYWNRESFEGYKTLCKEYEKDKHGFLILKGIVSFNCFLHNYSINPYLQMSKVGEPINPP